MDRSAAAWPASATAALSFHGVIRASKPGFALAWDALAGVPLMFQKKATITRPGGVEFPIASDIFSRFATPRLGIRTQNTVESPPALEVTAAAASDIAQVLGPLTDPANQNLAFLQGIWRGHDPDTWSKHPGVFITFAERILKLGEPLFAYDVVDEGIKRFSTNVRLRQLLALALARSGATRSANAVLAALYQEGHRDEETTGLLARTHKDLADEALDPAESMLHLQQAYALYSQAYQHSGGYWSAINAASLALVLGDRERSAELAREITARCRDTLKHTSDDRFWLLSTLGAAALLLSNWPDAEDWYGQAIAAAPGDWGSLQATRRTARLLMRHLDIDSSRIERLFKLPTIVVFAGHMIDRPDRDDRRFPAHLEPAVKRAIRQRLEELGAGFGFAGAACGSDILFHEAILDMNGETQVVLPYQKEVFVKESVGIVPGANWIERYESVVNRAVAVYEASKQSRSSGSVLYEFANLMLHGLASVRAEQLQTRLVPLVVWDGKAGDGGGGTASAVERWRASGLAVEIIDLAALREGSPTVRSLPATSRAAISVHTPEAAAGFRQEIRALLFADVEGFSKLNDEEVPRFVDHVLGLVARLAKNSAHKPLTMNTWGDGLYLVFANVGDAGEFALDLCDAVRGTDWAGKGLPDMSVRIGLHAGPVYACTDPVTERLCYVGPNVSRAARVEPITPAGHVYATQEFTALTAAENVTALRCEYVGQTAMAKKYGTYGTYVVRRRPKADERRAPSFD